MTTYRIADEPSPSHLSQYAVNPIFPLLAGMLCGVWAAWPWFVFNSKAVGSPTFNRELKWLVLGFLAIAGLVLFLFPALLSMEILPKEGFKYAYLAVTVTKLVVLYGVYALQSRTIEIYSHYGGTLRNGVWALIGLTWLSFKIAPILPSALYRVLF